MRGVEVAAGERPREGVRTVNDDLRLQVARLSRAQLLKGSR